MLKTADLSTVLPLAKILPILAVDKIGESGQQLASKTQQLLVGQTYQGLVTAKTADGMHLVEVNGQPLKMQLGAQVSAGQSLNLRMIQDAPTPTFYLLPNQDAHAQSETTLSPAATLIGKMIQQAEESGAPERYQATSVVTQQPGNPQQVAHDLKQAVQYSGLFYEAHLAEVVAGKRDIESMRIEMQNVNTANASAQNNPIPAQQLNLLEHQRLSWHGEVWPDQAMDWDVFVPEQHQNSGRGEAQDDQQHRPVFSEMTLYLPHLGKVSARVGIVDGRLNVSVLSDNAQALDTFKQARQQLFTAISSHGQQVQALTVDHYE